MDDIIIILIVLLIVASVSVYIYKKKKTGVKCIGCPDSGSCSGKCGCCTEKK